MIMARYKGLIPPAFLLDTALSSLKQSAQDARKGGALVESIQRRTHEKKIAGNWTERSPRHRAKGSGPRSRAANRGTDASARHGHQRSGHVGAPAWRRIYRWALRAQTTTNMPPDEVHQLGRDTLARLQAQKDVILKSLGYTKGTVGERMLGLIKGPGSASRTTTRAALRSWLSSSKGCRRSGPSAPGVPHARARQRRGATSSPAEEPGAAGAYGGAGSIDGTIPGKFWINLKPGFSDEQNRYTLPTLVHHEAIPGHVWQGEYANKLPLIRTLLAFNAYSEGWALYSEQLGDELGLYDNDPVGRLGYLNSISFRAARLVVDTGLHAKRWTREQARQFFKDATGNPNETEVDRYCSWPGQACGYEIGHQEIDRQRDRAKAALGQRFEFRAFNDAVVLGGNVPMDVLAKNVDEYIRTAKAGA